MGKSIEERLEELEKKVDDLTNAKQVKIRKSLGVGDTFQLVWLTWKILDITENGYMCHATETWKKTQFNSDSNNWEESNLRKEMNELADKIADEIGEDNIVPFERNLISMDGQTEYGTCTDRVSLLEFDEYRKYRSLLPNTDDYWWWMLTPWSTACNNDDTWVAVVSPNGHVNCNVCDSSYGVRPICILSPSIFESDDKDK